MCTTFAEPHRPQALRLPPGRARAFGVAMDQLVEELRSAIPAAFEGDEYRARRQVGEEEMKERHETAFGGLQRRAQEKHVALVRTSTGIALAPTRDGDVLSPEDFNKLDTEVQETIKTDIEACRASFSRSWSRCRSGSAKCVRRSAS